MDLITFIDFGLCARMLIKKVNDGYLENKIN